VTSILTGWREQYDRMKRSHARFLAVTDGTTAAASDDARDTLIHFYQDAYHLKDWIKNDSALGQPRPDVEAAIKAIDYLAICADLCNGVKHLVLNQTPRRGPLGAQFTSQGATMGLPQAQWPEPENPGDAGWIAHNWTIDDQGASYNAAELASLIVDAWDSWLRGNGLIGNGSTP
jgi:hypothetical protein